MLVKDKFLKKISHLITIVVIFSSPTLIAKDTLIKLLDYNNSLKKTSALFIQSDGKSIEEGIVYFGLNRIKIEYTMPKKITIILSEKKGVYINHDLKESQYFNTNKSYVKIFFKILKGSEFLETSKIRESKNIIELSKAFDLNDNFYKIKVIYENDPIKLRKIVILENSNGFEIGFFGHNNLKTLEKKFFSMVDPYLN